jgi:hypothetical protein
MTSIGYAFVSFPDASRLYCDLLDLRPDGAGGSASAGGDVGEAGAWGVAAAAAGALAEALARAQVRADAVRKAHCTAPPAWHGRLWVRRSPSLPLLFAACSQAC